MIGDCVQQRPKLLIPDYGWIISFEGKKSPLHGSIRFTFPIPVNPYSNHPLGKSFAFHSDFFF